MTTLTVLGSGSSGNCYFLESGDDAIIIDLGIGIRLFKKHTRNYGLNREHIRGIVLTHDHMDHVKAVGPLTEEQHIPVYASKAVHQGMLRNRVIRKKVPTILRRDITAGEPFDIGVFRLMPFHIMHDASDNLGYLISWNRPADLFAPTESGSLLLMTDVGTIPDLAATLLPEADYLVIESNYDELMLARGPYPARLKARIAGARGHSANSVTAQWLSQHLTPRTRQIWLCHLSDENNTPDIARNTVSAALSALPFTPPLVTPLPRRQPTGRFIL